MARRKAADQKPATTQQRLSAVIKRIRDLMRTDPGLNGDLDRLPQLSWLLFLKAFDDLERQREALEVDYQPLLADKHRWLQWAGNSRFTGDSLIDFVNDDLLPTLARLGDQRSSGPLARKVGDVFAGLENRMRSGYQLREVLNELGKVEFTSRDDIHTMAHLYESMLREVRDAAGDSGEFYTPRPVIRFMVQMVDPRPGETVLDPAAGTGGFLVESWEHLGGPKATSVQQRRRLQASLRGFEKKPLPYLLAMMNLILHGIDVPEVQEGNALTLLRETLTPAERVDVILTNPPFGGAESEDVVKTFPTQYRTAETAWLFVNTVLDKLKVGGRCGIVLPNGVLFGEGVGARIKGRLLRECNLHTVVRLPDGVFAPYTSIPTNLLFFERVAASPGPAWSTKETWFYEITPSGDRKRYTKTKPMPSEDFEGCVQWWDGTNRSGREKGARAWKVPIDQIVDDDFNLDLRNPNGGDELAHRPPQELVKELIETELEVLAVLEQLSASLEPG